MNYTLYKNKYDPKMLYPTSTWYSDEYCRDHCRMYLSTEYVEDDWSHKLHKYYRLHSSEPHTIDMSLGYEIQCPECKRHKMRQMGRSLNAHDLGLYYCPECDKGRDHL